ncbi:MAG: gliding motility-associated C-terminal domain-containing protein [Bacteroidetes bacterium]|nr:gliding motility-associated C-terminal domain-containing protein [Bacteroidota bacterium]
MKKLILFVALGFTFTGYSQFILNGDAVDLGDGCIQLTEEVTNQAGSVWYDTLISLENDFNVDFFINLGDLDAGGADGIAFVLQPVSTGLGSTGGGLGYDGIEPSVDVEFDTWQNAENNDPVYDHVSIMRDGVLDHLAETALTPATQIISGENNAEDGDFHKVNIVWLADLQTISVFVDCDLRVFYTGDIVADIFDGDPLVYMGFTAATGGSYNYQTVCFNYLTGLDELSDASVCPGDSVQLTVPAGFTSYLWSPDVGISDNTINNPYFSPTETTTYTVTISDECGFTISDTVIVTVASPDFLDLGPDKSLCEGQSFTFNAFTAGADSYLWSTGSILPTLTVFEAGEWWCEVAVGNCVDRDTVAAEYFPGPVINFGPDTTVCGIGETIFLDATTPGANYLWQDGSTGPTYLITIDGLYYVTVTLGGCVDKDSLAVNYSTYPSVNIGNDFGLCPEQTVDLYAGPNSFIYLWSDGSTSNTFTITEIGTYWVDVNSNGCTTRDSIIAITDPCLCEIIVPNAFTPNNDGINDEFKQLDCQSLNNFNMRIYNRWGEMMFETSDYNQGWDGKFKNNESEMGSYVYVIDYAIPEGESGRKSGSFTLVR